MSLCTTISARKSFRRRNSTIGTTEKIYAHFEEEEHLISAERIAKALQANPNNSGTRLLPNPKRNSDFEM